MKLAVVVILLAGAVVLAQTAPPDLILTNGKIITVDDQFRIAQAVAIRGDRIVAVEADETVLLTLSNPQYGATLGRWFGVSDADIDVIFPRLRNFGTRYLGFV